MPRSLPLAQLPSLSLSLSRSRSRSRPRTPFAPRWWAQASTARPRACRTRGGTRGRRGVAGAPRCSSSHSPAASACRWRRSRSLLLASVPPASLLSASVPPASGPTRPPQVWGPPASVPTRPPQVGPASLASVPTRPPHVRGPPASVPTRPPQVWGPPAAVPRASAPQVSVPPASARRGARTRCRSRGRCRLASAPCRSAGARCRPWLRAMVLTRRAASGVTTRRTSGTWCRMTRSRLWYFPHQLHSLPVTGSGVVLLPLFPLDWSLPLGSSVELQLGTSGLVVSFIYWVFGTSTVRGYCPFDTPSVGDR